eukprot:CAMPEP_0177284906 /NCGR_PEP_ID=MMETSP0367-20130122/72779_1 /TAXON_ID=447022 ORGANISM="Scrippsiella hangoei-like, Strain SHHI-4" /NCGR_SAMPLE_ID=MMETSP0367 /ASSEMBLY_ACC=CAM_ASM_000362 /LENGTH=323 /DNA_ID=CAMNT_0018741997 /DNA_START=97 /DNA_END=1065 /DNA_ORIENTATION=+
MSTAGSDTIEKTVEMTVTAMSTAPSFTKTFRVQQTKNKPLPTVDVAELSVAAPRAPARGATAGAAAALNGLNAVGRPFAELHHRVALRVLQVGVVFAHPGVVVSDVQRVGHGVAYENHQGNHLDRAHLPTHNGDHEEAEATNDSDHQQHDDDHQPWVPREEQDAEGAAQCTQGDRYLRAFDDGELGLSAHPSPREVICAVTRHGCLFILGVDERIPLRLVLQRLLCGAGVGHIGPKLDLASLHLPALEPKGLLWDDGVGVVKADEVVVEVAGGEAFLAIDQPSAEILNPALRLHNSKLISRLRLRANRKHSTLSPGVLRLECR